MGAKFSIFVVSDGVPQFAERELDDLLRIIKEPFASLRSYAVLDGTPPPLRFDIVSRERALTIPRDQGLVVFAYPLDGSSVEGGVAWRWTDREQTTQVRLSGRGD